MPFRTDYRNIIQKGVETDLKTQKKNQTKQVTSEVQKFVLYVSCPFFLGPRKITFLLSEC